MTDSYVAPSSRSVRFLRSLVDVFTRHSPLIDPTCASAAAPTLRPPVASDQERRGSLMVRPFLDVATESALLDEVTQRRQRLWTMTFERELADDEPSEEVLSA